MNETNFSDESILKLIKLPDLLSVLNALFGFTAILFVLRKANASAIENALVLILAAAVVDGLDGVVARKIGCSPIGKYLDSLADMVSFGVAPAIVTYVLLNDYLHVYAYTYITLALCGAYVISGMLRLARFDAKPFFQKEKGYFEGFPITMAAISLASFMLVFIELPLKFYPYFFLLIALMGVLCFLMTSRIRYRNRRDKRIAIPAGIIFFTLFFFYAFSLPFVYPAAVIFVLTASYIISPFFSLF
jgi:CDP-diacylglycerol--serine O-phosphatidyltransferase